LFLRRQWSARRDRTRRCPAERGQQHTQKDSVPCPQGGDWQHFSSRSTSDYHSVAVILTHRYGPGRGSEVALLLAAMLLWSACRPAWADIVAPSPPMGWNSWDA